MTTAGEESGGQLSRGGKLGRPSVAELGQPARLESAVFDGKFGPDGVALAGEFGRSSWASHAADAWDAAQLTGPVRVQTFRRVTRCTPKGDAAGAKSAEETNLNRLNFCSTRGCLPVRQGAGTELSRGQAEPSAG